MKPPRQPHPERRRALAEINLIGQKKSKSKPRRGGCAQIFGVLSLLVAISALATAWIGGR